MTRVHVVDGTYELFRHWFGAPPSQDPQGREVGATRGFLRSMLSMIKKKDVTHVGVAFDHTVTSFRNDMFDGYKTGEGIEPDLFAQFPLVERAALALGLVVWPMVKFEADDALAAAAAKFSELDEVEQILICTPDKDLAQCVMGDRIVCYDRRKKLVLNQEGVKEKFGVSPESIPDYLALVGDTADGIPGIPRWGAKGSATVLARYKHLENIPPHASSWDIKVRGAETLATNLRTQAEDAKLYRQLATLRLDAPIPQSLDEMKWQGVDTERLQALCDELGDRRLMASI